MKAHGYWFSPIIAATLSAMPFLPANQLHELVHSPPVALFGWHRLLLAQILLTLPLSWFIAHCLQNKSEILRSKSTRFVICSAYFVYLLIFRQTNQNAFLAQTSGVYCNTFLRTAFLVLMQSPLMIGLPAPNFSNINQNIMSGIALLLLAVVPPALYSQRLDQIHSDRLQTLLESGRFMAARDLTVQLSQIGSPKRVNHRNLKQLLIEIDIEIEHIVQELKTSGERSQRIDDQAKTAFRHLQLDDFQSAESVLLKASTFDHQAAILLGTIYREQERWSEAARLFDEILDHCTASDRDICFDNLAEAYRNLDRSVMAECVYHRAISESTQPALFHLKLGLLLADMARHQDAIEHLTTAAKLQPSLANQVKEPIRSLKTSTWSCFHWHHRSDNQ